MNRLKHYRRLSVGQYQGQARRTKHRPPRAIAKRGYEGAVTPDLDQQAQAVGLFLNDALLKI